MIDKYFYLFFENPTQEGPATLYYYKGRNVSIYYFFICMYIVA